MPIVGWFASDAPLFLGTGNRFRSAWWQAARRLQLSTEQRVRHLYVVGGSGTGKSRLASSLIRQDVDRGRGLTLVDPHRDLFAEILGYIAELALGPGPPTADRIAALGDKLIILEPSDQRFGVPGINLLEIGPGQEGYPLVDGIIEVVRELWPDSYGARMEDICRNALLLLQELGLTVLEMLPLLSDAAFRAALVARCRNPEVRLYFEQHLGGLRESEVKTWMESSRNKWNAFLANPFIRPILGQVRSTIRLHDVINQGKWLLVNISRDKLKESRRLLGALVVTLIHQAAIAREQTPMNQRVFHALWVDEFQEFFTPSFVHILEGGRKFALGLSLLHQNLTQPPFDRNPATVDCLLGNSHCQVVFNVARKDAERLAGELFFPSGTEIKHQDHLLGMPLERPTCWSMSEEREYYAAELMKQQTAQAYVKFKGVGDHEPYALRVPDVPDFVADPVKVDILRRHVARRYYRPLDQINTEIQQRWAAIRAGTAANNLPLGRDYGR